MTPSELDKFIADLRLQAALLTQLEELLMKYEHVTKGGSIKRRKKSTKR